MTETTGEPDILSDPHRGARPEAIGSGGHRVHQRILVLPETFRE